MATSMDDILSDKPAEPEKVEKTEPAEKSEPEEKAEATEVERPKSLRKEHQRREWIAQGRDPETGQFVATKDEKKEAKEPEAKKEEPEKKAEAKVEAKPPEKKPAEELTAKEKAAFAAAADERRKRQALEARLREIESKQPQQPAAAGDKPKAFWDDPEAWWKAKEEAEKQRDEQRRREAVSMRLQFSEDYARSRYADFDEKIAAFSKLVETTPGLGQQMIQSRNPAEFAYKTAKNHMELTQAGNLEKLRADIEAKARADERAKIEAEYKAKADEVEKQRAALPPSLSDVRGAAPRKSTPVWTGPTSMDDILKH